MGGHKFIAKRIANKEEICLKRPTTEASICLNCPFEKCVQSWSGCEFFKSEMKRLRGLKNEKGRKKTN